MLKKIFSGIFILTTLIGVVILAGVVGGIDTDIINLSEIIKYSCRGIILLLISAVGLNFTSEYLM